MSKPWFHAFIYDSNSEFFDPRVSLLATWFYFNSNCFICWILYFLNLTCSGYDNEELSWQLFGLLLSVFCNAYASWEVVWPSFIGKPRFSNRKTEIVVAWVCLGVDLPMILLMSSMHAIYGPIRLNAFPWKSKSRTIHQSNESFIL